MTRYLLDTNILVRASDDQARDRIRIMGTPLL